jgi:DNA polymerase-4
MAALGILTGADLRERSLEFLEQHFGKSSRYLYHACRGEDDRPVRPNRERKSVGAERTYAQDLVTDAALSEALEGIIDTVWPRIEAHHARGRTITLKIKFADFQQITRARSLRPALDDRETFARIAREILQGELPVSRGVRLLGLTLSGLEGLDRETDEESAAEPQGIREARPKQQTLVF